MDETKTAPLDGLFEDLRSLIRNHPDTAVPVMIEALRSVAKEELKSKTEKARVDLKATIAADRARLGRVRKATA